MLAACLLAGCIAALIHTTKGDIVRAIALVEMDTSTRHLKSLIVGYFKSVILSKKKKSKKKKKE